MMKNYQGKRPDQIENSEKISAYAFIAAVVFFLIWGLLV
jgi:hypothetical protein